MGTIVLIGSLMPARGLAAGCASTSIDLKLLVLSGNGQEVELPAVQQALDVLGVPYTLWVASDKPGQLTPDQLATPCHANYQGVILTSDTLGYTATNGQKVASGLSDAEWQALQTYEQTYAVRRVNWYTNPTPLTGFNWSQGGVDTTISPIQAQLTPAGQSIFNYVHAGAQIPIEGAWTSLATPLADGTTQPLLTDAQGDALAAIHTDADGRQQLSLTFHSNPQLIQDLVLWYGLVNWVSRGIFLGERHAYLKPMIDDLFYSGGTWTPGLACNAKARVGGGEYRTTGADIVALETWQRSTQSNPVTQQLMLAFAFIAAGAQPGASVPDTLIPQVEATADQFHWINHTYTHHYLDDADYQTAHEEISRNMAMANQLELSAYNPANLVTPDYTGLANPAAMQAAFDAGVRNVATDASATGYNNPSANTGITLSGSYQDRSYQLLGIPRQPTNLLPSESQPTEWVAEDHCRFPPGSYAYAAAYPDILRRESTTLLRLMLSGNVDPVEFHALNVRAYDGTHSLLSDLLDMTLQRYEALVDLPVRSQTMDEIARQMTERMHYNAALPQLSAVLVSDSTGTFVQLESPQAMTVPITGLTTSTAENYAGQPISTVVLDAGTPLQLPVSDPAGDRS